MPYKTVLLYFRNEKSAEQVLAAGGELAQRHQAHVIGLYVIPPVVLSVAPEVPLGSDIIGIHRKAYEAEAKRIKATFDRTMSNQSFVSEWRTIDAEGYAVPAIVADQASSADITVVSQGDDQIIDYDETVVSTVFDSGRPVLVVPYVGTKAAIGKNVLVAWNGRREAARATFDAIPLLKEADIVHILSIDAQKSASPQGIPGGEIAATLARHGVTCETVSTASGDIGVGDTILNYVGDNGIDLIVMGCYGHSRLREFIFGGATNRILSNMTAPVLMSH